MRSSWSVLCSYAYHFLIGWVVASVCVAQNYFSLQQPSLSILLFAHEEKLKLALALRSLIWKIWHAHISFIIFWSCLRIIMTIRQFEEKSFINSILNKNDSLNYYFMWWIDYHVILYHNIITINFLHISNIYIGIII